MAIIVKFGFRTYELENESDLIKACSLWARLGLQDIFENEMKKEGIDFSDAFFDEDI